MTRARDIDVCDVVLVRHCIAVSTRRLPVLPRSPSYFLPRAERYEAGFKPLLAEAEARHAAELQRLVDLQRTLEAKEVRCSSSSPLRSFHGLRLGGGARPGSLARMSVARRDAASNTRRR